MNMCLSLTAGQATLIYGMAVISKVGCLGFVFSLRCRQCVIEVAL